MTQEGSQKPGWMRSRGPASPCQKKITREIFQVGGSWFTAVQDAAIYLVAFQGHAALVHAGCGLVQERLFMNIRDCGIEPGQIEYLFIPLSEPSI